MNIFLGIIAVILLLGMIADNDQQNRINFTWGFIVVIVATTVLNLL